MQIYQFSKKILNFKNDGQYKDALAYFKENKILFTPQQVAENEFLVSSMLTVLRKSNNVDHAFRFLKTYGIQIDEHSKDVVLNAYGWLLHNKLKMEMDNAVINHDDEDFVDDEDCLWEGNYLDNVNPSNIIFMAEKLICLLKTKLNDFNYVLFSNLLNTVLKVEKCKASPSWKQINNICDLVEPGILSVECKSIDVTLKGFHKTIELASDREMWYAYKTKALLKLGQYTECYELAKEALTQITKFHYSNDVWLTRRIAIAKKCGGDIDDAIKDFELILQRKKEWFIQKELAELYKCNGKIEEAFEYAIKAVCGTGPIEYKVDLLFCLGDLLLQKGEQALAFKHYSLSRLIRLTKEWSIPSKLTSALDEFSEPALDVSSLGALKVELTKYWRSNCVGEAPKRGRMSGKVLKLLHNDKKGADGFIEHDNRKESSYFRLNPTDPLILDLGVGLEVTFEIQAATDDKKARAIKVKKKT